MKTVDAIVKAVVRVYDGLKVILLFTSDFVMIRLS